MRIWTYGWGVLGGALAILALQALLIFGVGVHVEVPKAQAYRLGMQAASHLQTVRAPFLDAVKPLVTQEVNRMVGEVTLDVGGVRVPLPDSLQVQLAKDINRLLLANLNQYLSRGFNPKAFLTPQVIKEILARPLVLRVWVRTGFLPIPVTVSLGGR